MVTICTRCKPRSLYHNPHPSDKEIREGLSGNLCRCTGYLNIESAVRAAEAAMAGGTASEADS